MSLNLGRIGEDKYADMKVNKSESIRKTADKWKRDLAHILDLNDLWVLFLGGLKRPVNFQQNVLKSVLAVLFHVTWKPLQTQMPGENNYLNKL